MPPRTRPTVLLVEDDPLQLADCMAKVMKAGCAVLSAPSAERGIRMTRSLRIDAILTDNHLPGMSGLSSIAAYAKHSRAPVLLMTSDYSADFESDAILLGARCCLKKPLDLERLRLELATALRQGG